MGFYGINEYWNAVTMQEKDTVTCYIFKFRLPGVALIHLPEVYLNVLKFPYHANHGRLTCKCFGYNSATDNTN